jgi:hypothetical protein
LELLPLYAGECDRVELLLLATCVHVCYYWLVKPLLERWCRLLLAPASAAVTREPPLPQVVVAARAA